MTNPFQDAAQRAIEKCRVAQGFFYYPDEQMEIAAREMAAPIRELHKRRQKMTMSICDHCRAPWPCATARLVYAEEELT